MPTASSISPSPMMSGGSSRTLLPEGDGFAGKSAGDLQNLFEAVHKAWEPYGQLPSRLPTELAERHARIHAEAVERAKGMGWDAELGEDD